jgi:DedD protein
LSTPFQNRLVGTIIVAAVVIIFLPDVLDGEKKSHQTDFEAIPKAAVFSGKLTDRPFPADKLNKPKVVVESDYEASDDIIENNVIKSEQTDIKLADKAKAKAVKVKTLEKADSQLSKKLPEKAIAKEAWVIHLGSFKDKENVAQLLKKLKANGYIAFTRPIKTKKGVLTKVIIGPELIKSALIKKIPALHELTGIKGKVANFEPTKS